MKMHIEMDMTAQEARALMGLPDIAPMQQQMMEQMQERMKAAFDAGDPEGAMQTWMPLFYGTQGGSEVIRQWQKAMWDSASAMTGQTGGNKTGGK